MKLTLIRHGITQGNLEKRYIGRRNDQSLVPEGIRQLMEYQAQGRYPQVDAVYSSPLKRCIETASILYPLMTPVILPSLIELDFGSFEGKDYEQLKTDPAYRRWIDTAGMYAPTGGEDGAAFIARLKQALRQIAADADRLAIQHSAVVTHGGCIMTILSHLAKNSPSNREDFYRYRLKNGAGYTLDMDTQSLWMTSICPLV